MTTFAALGDSITLGVGDPAPGGGWRGWAAFLAESLPGGRLVNLAGNGARVSDVERTQLPRALELRPDVASVVVGVNDILRTGFDAARIQSALAHVTGSLSAAGAVVLTMRLPDPGLMLGLPAALARPLGRRLQVINEVMDQVAAEFGTVHFDVPADLATQDRRMWSADRLHPNERGHRYIAARFHDQLAARGQRLGPRPGTEPTSPPPTRLDTATWMATKGTAWVLRRCTDLVPYLLVMALRECWPGPGHVLLLLTEWPEFAAADPEILAKTVARQAIVDARHALDADAWRGCGWDYRAPGRPNQPALASHAAHMPPYVAGLHEAEVACLAAAI